MGPRHRPPTPIEDRFVHDPAENIFYGNVEGLALETAEQAAILAEGLDEAFRRVGHRVHVIVNYDNVDVLPVARPPFFAMVERTAQYALSRTRYSTNALLGNQFAAARLEHRLVCVKAAERRTGALTAAGETHRWCLTFRGHAKS
jgi:propionate CoA-transferase